MGFWSVVIHVVVVVGVVVVSDTNTFLVFWNLLENQKKQVSSNKNKTKHKTQNTKQQQQKKKKKKKKERKQTGPITASTCNPHPAHVVFPQSPHFTNQHIPLFCCVLLCFSSVSLGARWKKTNKAFFENGKDPFSTFFYVSILFFRALKESTSPTFREIKIPKL